VPAGSRKVEVVARRVGVILAALVLVSGCSGSDESGFEGGGISAGGPQQRVEFEGVEYLLDCRSIHSDSPIDPVVGEAPAGFSSVGRVDGHDILIAVLRSESECEFAGSEWVVGMPIDPDTDPSLDMVGAYVRADCEVFVSPSPECTPELGYSVPLSNENPLRTAYDYFPEIVEDIDRRLAAGDPEVAWRLEPQQTVLEWWKTFGLCQGDEGDWLEACRLGLRQVNEVTYEVLYQAVTWVNDPPEHLYNAALYTVEVEQLSNGPSWWVTSLTENQLTDLYEVVGPISQDRWDADWDSCCDLTIRSHGNL
jgi:hypothetical protein